VWFESSQIRNGRWGVAPDLPYVVSVCCVLQFHAVVVDSIHKTTLVLSLHFSQVRVTLVYEPAGALPGRREHCDDEWGIACGRSRSNNRANAFGDVINVVSVVHGWVVMWSVLVLFHCVLGF